MMKQRPMILLPIVRKCQKRITTVVVLLAVPMMGLVLWGLVTESTNLTSLNLAMQVGMVALVGSLAIVGYGVVWFLKLTARITRLDDAACVYCSYSLIGLGEAGVCPECSEPFTLAEARALWNNARLRPSKRQPLASARDGVRQPTVIRCQALERHRRCIDAIDTGTAGRTPRLHSKPNQTSTPGGHHGCARQ